MYPRVLNKQADSWWSERPSSNRLLVAQTITIQELGWSFKEAMINGKKASLKGYIVNDSVYVTFVILEMETMGSGYQDWL